jgi:[protein-PII] uridylyltransferase
MEVKELLERRPRPAPPSRRSRVEPRVSFDSVGSSRATLIEIIAQDRPGLLYDLARTISSAGGNIEVVLVDTEAHKAIDVFYVTFGGRKLTSGAEIPLRESLLSVCRT